MPNRYSDLVAVSAHQRAYATQRLWALAMSVAWAVCMYSASEEFHLSRFAAAQQMLQKVRSGCRVQNSNGCLKFDQSNGWLQFCPLFGEDRIDPADSTDKGCVSLKAFRAIETNLRTGVETTIDDVGSGLILQPDGDPTAFRFNKKCAGSSLSSTGFIPCLPEDVVQDDLIGFVLPLRLELYASGTTVNVRAFLFTNSGTISYAGKKIAVAKNSFMFDIYSERYIYLDSSATSIFSIELMVRARGATTKNTALSSLYGTDDVAARAVGIGGDDASQLYSVNHGLMTLPRRGTFVPLDDSFVTTKPQTSSSTTTTRPQTTTRAQTTTTTTLFPPTTPTPSPTTPKPTLRPIVTPKPTVIGTTPDPAATQPSTPSPAPSSSPSATTGVGTTATLHTPSGLTTIASTTTTTASPPSSPSTSGESTATTVGDTTVVSSTTTSKPTTTSSSTAVVVTSSTVGTTASPTATSSTTPSQHTTVSTSTTTSTTEAPSTTTQASVPTTDATSTTPTTTTATTTTTPTTTTTDTTNGDEEESTTETTTMDIPTNEPAGRGEKGRKPARRLLQQQQQTGTISLTQPQFTATIKAVSSYTPDGRFIYVRTAYESGAPVPEVVTSGGPVVWGDVGVQTIDRTQQTRVLSIAFNTRAYAFHYAGFVAAPLYDTENERIYDNGAAEVSSIGSLRCRNAVVFLAGGAVVLWHILTLFLW